MVDFGRVEFRRDQEITGRVTVTCSEPGPFEVSASAGNGDFGGRLMRGPKGDELRYNLYVDAARRRVWGDASCRPARRSRPAATATASRSPSSAEARAAGPRPSRSRDRLQVSPPAA
jgi:spore coat protein U-like protein